jgi:fructose/tagatose bisphosphate aldolase
MEAELGELPCGAGDTPGSGELTDPEEAVAFVADTGIDILAVSVGNVHIKLDGEQGLDLERLARLHECLSIPLDLHGGTGIPVEALQAAIGLGVAKVCYGTYVKQRYLEALRNALAGSEPNPHRLLGMGGSDDLLVRGRWAVRDAVLERIEYLGCCGRVA